MDLTSAFAEYELKELRQSPRTVQAYRERLKALERFFGKQWWEITHDELREFKRTDRYAVQTISSMITALRQAHRWGALEGLWKLNGICEVRGPKVTNQSHPPLSPDDTRTLLASCVRPLEYRLVYLPLYAGMRISEAARIGEDEWKDGLIRFAGAKTRRVREIPVHPELAKVRSAILCSPVSTPSNIHRAKNRMKRRVGIEFSLHNLRSTFAHSLEESDTPWEVLASLLGHALGVTERYAVVSLRRKREAIEALAYGLQAHGLQS